MTVHDATAEEAVLGCMLLSASAIDVVSQTLTAGDFYTPSNALIYDTLIRLRASGIKVDAVTAWDEIKRNGGDLVVKDPSVFVSLTANVPSTTSARHYAGIVSDRGLRRRMVTESVAWRERAEDLTLDSDDVLSDVRLTTATMGSALLDTEPDDMSVWDFMELYDQPSGSEPWVIHGLIRKRHKMMVVGTEGGSKSWLMRFIALCASYGIQPWRHTQIRPVRTMIIDAENPEDAMAESFKVILKKMTAERSDVAREDIESRVWHRPAGINLRSKIDQAEFENLIRARRPELVCLGPMYCVFETKPGEPWETPARQVQAFLKAMMVRYDFALIIEDHAPQDRSGGMRPYGSSFWRRWLDMGVALEPLNDERTSYEMKHWRGSRVTTDWPKYVHRSDTWPFIGGWEGDTV